MVSKPEFVEWDKITQPEFDRIVEHLLLREHKEPSKETWIVNGRGGDGGLDIRVIKKDDSVLIYQLKFFPGGFSSNHNARRKQIKNSFRSALTYSPEEWVLVVPDNLTRGERKFLLALNGERSVPKIRWIGRAELDELSVRHQNVIAALITRNPLLEALKLTGHVGAGDLMGANGLEGRLSWLAKDKSLREAQDANWDLQMFSVGRENVMRFVPKHEHSEGLVVELDLGIASEDALASTFEKAYMFGGPLPEIIPSSLIQKVSVSGTTNFNGTIDNPDAGFYLGDSNLPPQDLRDVTIQFNNGGLFLGTVDYANSGVAGLTLRIRIANALTLMTEIPSASELGINLSFSVELVGHRARSLKRACEFVSAMTSAGTEMEMMVNSRSLKIFHGTPNPNAPDTDLGWFQVLNEFVTDLVIIEEAIGEEFPLTHYPSPKERVLARAFALMVQGKRTFLPGVESINVFVTEESAWNRERLESAQTIAVRAPYTLSFFGKTYRFPAVRAYLPAAIGKPTDKHDAKGNAEYAFASVNEECWSGFLEEFISDKEQGLELWALEPLIGLELSEKYSLQ